MAQNWCLGVWSYLLGHHGKETDILCVCEPKIAGLKGSFKQLAAHKEERHCRISAN